MEYNFGEKVEQLLIKKGKTKKSLYDFLGMTANGLDAMIRNNSISAARLAQIADYFEMPILHFYGDGQSESKKNEDSGSFGEQVIGKMATDIWGIRQDFAEQLKTKDRQIAELYQMNAGLSRMLESVLGKFEGVTDDQLSEVMTIFGRDFNEYVMGAMLSAIQLLKPTSKLIPHEVKAGGTQFSYVGNLVTLK